MIESVIDTYQLPAAAVGELATRPFGELNPVLTFRSEATTPFTAIDCFDQSLRRSGRLLLETAATFELLSNGSWTVSQPANPAAQFVSDFQNGPVKQALAGFSPLRKLLPLGSGQIQQAVLSFVDSEEKTHCRAHLTQLTTQKGHTAELVALQGVKGYDESLNALREHIRDLQGDPLSISALYDQLFPTLTIYEPKPKVHIAVDATAFDAANEIITSHIPVARANEHGIIADHDTEFLHDYRIQLRKIRSVLSLFKGIYDDIQTADLKARFSALMAPTGRLRDIDVYLLERQTYYDLVPAALHSGLDTLYSLIAKQREAERGKLSRHLRSKDYKQEMADLAVLFEDEKNLKPGPNAHLLAHDYGCELIWKRYRKVCKVASEIGPDTDDTEVHALRIHCKKLRYLMEFFNPVFPGTAFKKLLKPLKGLQDNLGLFNDYSVQQESLRMAVLDLPGNQNGPDLEVAQSVGALIAVLHSRQRKERAKVAKSFEKFNSPKTRQTFSELFRERKDYI